MKEAAAMNPPTQELLTVSELAERLQVKVSWVYTHADELGAYRLGKYLRFDWYRVLERLPHFGIHATAAKPD
jgi:excisionase family DNA binding protein